MARPSPYDDQTKAAIIQAAVDARKEGKQWGEALSAAKNAGYKGGQQYLVKMIRGSGASGAIKARGKRRGKPGRPSGAKRRGRPAKATKAAGSGLGAIQGIVDKMVAARIATVLQEAVATLESAAKELNALR